MRLLCSFLAFLILEPFCNSASAERLRSPVISLFTGQWVELRDLDPATSNRDVRHIWLHRGALLFGVNRPQSDSPFRDAVSYFGLPVRILAMKRDGGWHIKNVEEPIRSSFHLTRNVFCPGESNPIVLQGDCLRGRAPLGEGYVFDLHRVDADGDGVPDQENNQDFFEVRFDLDKRTAEELSVEESFVFKIYEQDLDRYEDEGVLFRLDRPHPLREVRFLDSKHQPCGATETSEIKKTNALKAYSDAEGKAGFNFWGWLSSSLTVGASVTATQSDEESIKLTSTTSEGTTFRQWGLIFDYSADTGEAEDQTPFYVEKVFECVSDIGQARFGDRVKKVEIGLFDHFNRRNRVFEFSRPEDLQIFNDRVLDKVDKPVFISINSSELQSAALDLIKKRFGIEDHYLAMLIFSQLNLACPESDREECLRFLAEQSG